MHFSFAAKRRWNSLKFPTFTLLAILQRTPAVQLAATAEEMFVSSPVGVVLKSFAAIAATLGAVNSLAGATPLVPSSNTVGVTDSTATGVSAAVGTAVQVVYTVTGTQTPPESWTIGGTIPPGLSFSGLTAAGTVNVQSLVLSGTPTVGGTFQTTIRAWEFSSGTGVGSPTYNYTITITGTPAEAPAITTQPQSQTVDVGANVTFAVAVTGNPAPTLQWQKNNANISGATSSSLALNNVQLAAAGTYRVIATNLAGTVTSAGATLVVNIPNVAPSFTTQPQSQSVNVGTIVTFTAAVAGTPAPTLQWRKDGVDLANATGVSLVLNDVQTAAAGTYTLVATNAAGSTTSNDAVLTVNVPVTAPSFTTQPQSQIAGAGANVTFMAAVEGNPTPTLQWRKNGIDLGGQTGSSLALTNVQAGDAGTYSVVATNSAGTTASNDAVLAVNTASQIPAITTQPQSQAVTAGGNVTLTAAATGDPAPTLQWQRNGLDLDGATSGSLMLTGLEPADAGLYSVLATNATAATASQWAIVGVLTTAGAIGDGSVVATQIQHPNGKFYDQVVLTGTATAISTQGGRTTRTSFIDDNNDIVQVEFAGAGTLSLVLDDPSGPAVPVNYTQNFNYMKGHVGLVVTGADETTNILVFTVGRATAFDPTGHYNILQAPSGTNDPATNGSPLFAGHSDTVYDGFADIAFIAIASTNGNFGGLRASNAHFSAVNGLTGVYAPGVTFAGPVFIGDIDAGSVSETEYATPAIIIGSTPDARITGGDLLQTNGKPVQVHGLTQLKFTAGSDSGGNLFPALANQAVLEDNGVDVTSQIVSGP